MSFLNNFKCKYFVAMIKTSRILKLFTGDNLELSVWTMTHMLYGPKR